MCTASAQRPRLLLGAPAASASSASASQLPPAVVMKMDIESGEFAVLPRLLSLGVLCKLDAALIEYHAEQKEPCVAATDDGPRRAAALQGQRPIPDQPRGRRLQRLARLSLSPCGGGMRSMRSMGSKHGWEACRTSYISRRSAGGQVAIFVLTAVYRDEYLLGDPQTVREQTVCECLSGIPMYRWDLDAWMGSFTLVDAWWQRKGPKRRSSRVR